ncbi:hypothetical protein B0H14DRAFT_1537479 [Mycena olivaceomarginata]|nr:hypothetical protein B0H14DRAFT_1537479 [Mycena olivaceomarginata]
MRVISYLSLFSSCLAGTRALVISTPQFLTAGPARINFTKEESDPVGAFFNIVVASNASRLADDVDLSAGFVDIDILVLPGTYSIFAFGNDTGGGRDLGSTEDFPVIDVPTSPPVYGLVYQNFCYSSVFTALPQAQARHRCRRRLPVNHLVLALQAHRRPRLWTAQPRARKPCQRA